MSFNDHNSTVLELWDKGIEVIAPSNLKSLSLKVVKCENCGASLPSTQASEVIHCHYCSTKKYNSHKDSYSSEYNSFIRLGMKCKFYEKEYQVVGRAIYYQDYKEYYYEDGESGYSKEFWVYHTWVLLGANGEVAYLNEDEEGYSFSEKFEPSNPKVPKSSDIFTSFTGGKDKRIIEKGKTTIGFLEGEFPWEAYVGQTQKFFTYTEKKNLNYSIYYEVEGDLKKPINPLTNEKHEISNEIEFYRDKKISYPEVLKAFEIKSLIKRENKYQYFRKIIILNFFFATLLLFIGIYNSFTTIGGEEIYKEVVYSRDITEKGYNLPSFNLGKSGKNYAIYLSSKVPRNTWSWFALELVSEEDGPVAKIEKDFWNEGGESDTSKHEQFKLDKEGKYFLRVFNENKNPSHNTKLSISIREGVFIAKGFILAAFALLILTFINLKSLKKLR